jgi:hypothetical protein
MACVIRMSGIDEARWLQRREDGLRLCRWRPGEAWRAVSQPLWKERETANNLKGFGVGKRGRRLIRRGGKSAGDELAQCAVVFLVDARATGVLVIFDVRTDRGGRDVACRRRVNNADDARRYRLRERSNEDPTTYNSRNASTHSVVSCGRELAQSKPDGLLPQIRTFSRLIVSFQYPEAFIRRSPYLC